MSSAASLTLDTTSSITTTSSTTSSSLVHSGGVTYYANAHRQRGGICIGTIWCCIISSKNNHVNNSKQQRSNLFAHSLSNLFRGGNATIDPCNIRNAIPMHCILIGHVLYAYESEAEYIRGETPIHLWTIVGASIWFPQRKQQPQQPPPVTSAKKTTEKGTAASAATVTSTTDAPTSTSTAPVTTSSSFRFVTNQGTQVYCWTNTINHYDCMIWLSSIQTGLQLSLEYSDITPAVMPVVPPIIPKAAAATSTTVSNDTLATTTPSAISSSSIRYCRVCGVLAASNANSVALSIVDPNFYSSAATQQQQQQQHYIPLIQYGIEDKYGPPGNDNGPASPSNASKTSLSNSHTTTINPNYYVCTNCNIAQGVVQYIQFIRTLYIADAIEQSIILQFYKSAMKAIVDEEQKAATAAVIDDLESSLRTNGNNGGSDTADDTVIDKMDSVDNSNVATTISESGSTNEKVDTNVEEELNADRSSIAKEGITEGDNSGSIEPVPVSRDDATDVTTQILFNFVQGSKSMIDEWTRQCGTLYNLIYDAFLPGYIDGTELIEVLEEMIGADNIDTTQTSARCRSGKVSASILKQQAFRNCAGDMGTAMKLLLEQAIPNNNSNNNSSSSGSTSKGMDSSSRNDTFSNNQSDNIDVFRCVLEFLLDLCDNDNNRETANQPEDTTASAMTTAASNLSSIAFFWPQLCHIHLRMLPATNATSLARIDLMEDFLLTVATKYSIHLALELVWSHTADLEESLQVSSSAPPLEQSIKESSSNNTEANNATPSLSTNVSSACRRRRFAIIRFLCELESLLFDFDGGWGGGSVTLGKMFIPTPHQVHIMKVAMTYIQQYRMGIINENDTNKTPIRSKSRCLSRSARWDRLLREYDTSEACLKSPTAQAQEKLQIAKHADYFSSHLIFSKRLADIAEKLRFLDVADRSGVLEHELNLLNASGVMGGDPLNRLREHLIRVVRVPSTESHVFRSKERTPILLLMEIIDEKNDAADSASHFTSNNTEAATPSSNDSLHIATTADDTEENNNVKVQNPTVSETLSTGQPTSETSTAPSEQLKDDSNIDDVPKPPPHTPNSLEGASEGNIRLSPGPKALKRFDVENDLSSTPSRATPKNAVQKIVSNAAEEQLRDIVLPNLDHIPSMRTDDVNGRGDTTESDISITNNVKAKKHNDLDDSMRGSTSRKISTLSTLKGINDNTGGDSTNTLAPTGDIRRAVLTTIMMRGLQGNSIAAGTTNSVQLSLKELERKRATELLLSDDGDNNASKSSDTDIETTREKLFALGLTPSLEEVELASRPTEEDEVLEAIRLMLIQNQVAQGNLSPADAAKVLQHTSLSPINAVNTSSKSDDEAKRVDKNDHPTIDAGDVDPRLVGCGPLPPAVLQALTLWKGGMVTHAELLELVKKDIEFVKHSILVDAENLNMLQENSAFWGRFAFGERWAEKKSRIGSSSPQSSTLGWDLMGVIVKSNDDLRQEAFVMQLIELCQEAFELAELELWISPYRILATGRTTGVIECVRNAMSFDALKKRPGYGKGGLREHLHRMTEFTADPGGSFKSAQQNFVRSLAAYSLLSYIFQFKDRHNGNLLLDTAGHVIHIDFGFVFGIAPGGSFSLEMSTPFKLTEEMLDVMGGLRSPLFSEFVTLFCCGYLALQAHCETFLTLVEITSRDSTFKCFDGRDTDEIVAKLRERFSPDLSKEETVSFALDLIKQATTSYGTRQYDIYQYLSQGIY